MVKCRDYIYLPKINDNKKIIHSYFRFVYGKFVYKFKYVYLINTKKKKTLSITNINIPRSNSYRPVIIESTKKNHYWSVVLLRAY